MNSTNSKTNEVESLINAVNKRYGYDFSNYSRPTLIRRIESLQHQYGYESIGEMIPELLSDEQLFSKLIYKISVVVTEMFRDPEVYLKIRNNLKCLDNLPYIRVWCAGCGSGQEAYSLAILLKEEGLYDRCQIYATDINDMALESARRGIYDIREIKEYTRNHQISGGNTSLSEYYFAKDDSIIMDNCLRDNICFSHHNLVMDGSFGQMNLIMCRNVLIYFDPILQSRVLSLFTDSLEIGGILCLGSKESIRFQLIYNQYKTIADNENIFQKIEIRRTCKTTDMQQILMSPNRIQS